MSYLRSETDFLLIGELAEAAGVSRDTLRHYERKGVLERPVRSQKGYRLYSVDSVERVKTIRRALAVGFTLDEIARVFAERSRGNAPCREVYALAATKLDNVRERISEMEKLRDELENLIFEWDKKLGQVSQDEPVHLLEDLADLSNEGVEKRRKLTAENLRRQNEKGNKKR